MSEQTSKPEPALLPRPTVGYKSRQDAVGLWEFRHKEGIRSGYHQWWDGEHLRFSQDGPKSGLRVEDCTDFIGPLVPAAEVRELRELLAWADDFIERCKGGITSYTDYHLRMHVAVKKALAASEAGKEASNGNHSEKS